MKAVKISGEISSGLLHRVDPSPPQFHEAAKKVDIYKNQNRKSICHGENLD